MLAERSPLLSNNGQQINNATIRFINCTFTYLNFPRQQSITSTSTSVSRPTRGLMNKVFAKVKDKGEVATRQLGNIVGGRPTEKRLQDCIFPFVDGEKTLIKNYIAKFPPNPRLVFRNCNFTNRAPTCWEKTWRWILVNIFGSETDFTLVQEGNAACIVVDGGTFLLESIPDIVQHILSRVQDPGVFDV